MQAVARLARLPVPDAVRQNDEIAPRIEQLAVAEQRAREFGPNELRAASTRSMQDQDRVTHNPLRVALRRPERAVMKAQFRQLLARRKAEILDDEIALRRCGILCRVDARKYEPRDAKRKDSEHGSGSRLKRREQA